MEKIVIGIIVLITVCFIVGLLLEGTVIEKTASKSIGIIVTVSLVISVFSLIFNIKQPTPEISLTPDYSYINEITTHKLNIIKRDLIKKLEDNNVINAKIYFSTSSDNNQIRITKIHLDLTNAEYNSSATNINTLKEYVISVVDIDKENILVYV